MFVGLAALVGKKEFETQTEIEDAVTDVGKEGLADRVVGDLDAFAYNGDRDYTKRLNESFKKGFWAKK